MNRREALNGGAAVVMGLLLPFVPTPQPYADGGVFVPEAMADAFIGELRKRAFVRQANAVLVDLTAGNLRVPRLKLEELVLDIVRPAGRDAALQVLRVEKDNA